MHIGSGIEIDPDSFFAETGLIHAPTILDLLKVTTVAEFEALSAATVGTAKKVPCCVILTPALAEAFQSSNMQVSDLFIKAIEFIKANVTVPTIVAGVAETADQILTRIGGPYKPVLDFLWAAHHSPVEVSSPTMSCLQDADTIEWDTSTKLSIFPPPSPAAPSSIPTNSSNAGAISAMTKLSESMIEYQKATLKHQESKNDNRTKAWNKLPRIQQNVLLLGGIDSHGSVPSEITEEMLSVLGCSNGAQVEQYLKQCMPSNNMMLEPGFCSAINKGIFVHSDDSSSPKHFTPFLTPPVSDHHDLVENGDLLKLAVQDKFNNEDLVLLTKMSITIPLKTQDLKHHVKNIAVLSGLCLGGDSLLFQNLQDVAKHIEEKELSYDYEFRQERLFGGNFLDRLHWRIHRFFDSCASGDAQKVDLDKLDFTDVLNQIEKREYICKVPSWITSLMKKRESNRIEGNNRHSNFGGYGVGHGGGHGGGRHGGNCGRGRGRNQRRSFISDQGGEQGRSIRIPNPTPCQSCRLAPHEQYKDIFHPGNLRRLTTRPKNRNGQQLCLRFHTLGYCFQDCRYTSGHGTLNSQEEAEMVTAITQAHEIRATHQQQYQGQHSKSPPRAPNNVNGTIANGPNVNQSTEGESPPPAV